MTEAEVRAAHPDWTDDQVAAEVAKQTAPVDSPAVVEPETVTMPKAEAEALRRRVAESEKAQRKIEADRKKAEEERQAEEGKYKELAEAKDRELAQERAERARVQREQRITRLASKAKFLDPADVIGRVSAEDGEDDTLTEAALARIAESSPHLVSKPDAPKPEIGEVLTPSAVTAGKDAPQPPAGKAPLRTMVDVDALSEAEMVARMDEVDAVLAQQ
jgi:hypothetical protein